MLSFVVSAPSNSGSLCMRFFVLCAAPPVLLARVTARRRVAVAISIIAMFCSAGVKAQAYRGGENARALIVQPIDEARLVTLVGNTHPAATAANDRGPVPDNMPIKHMQLVLQRPPELEKELENLIDEQQTKGSPNFHKWLTAQEFGQRFGAAPQDIEKVSSWLESHGFRVDSVPPSGMVIEFSGNAGQVKQAFHTEIHNLDVDGKPHFANMSDPQIPAALAGVVKGIHALHNFMPHSMLKPRPKFTFPCPVPSGCSTAATFYAVVPADLATIYNLNPAYSAGFTGTGQTVVVIEDTLLKNTSDVATFRSAFGLSGYSGTFSQITATGSTTCNSSGVNADEGEAALDAEWAGASAPNAAVELASCADTETVFGGLIALQNLINGANPPPIVSISYGECESENGMAANASYVSAYQQAASEGASVFVSAGDEGAASCDADLSVATHGIAVSGFASTPYNVAVGGTDFGDTYASMQPSGLPLSTYWNSSNSSAFGSALSYIPEIPWNDSCASELIYTTNGFTQSYGSAGMCNSKAIDPFGNTYEDDYRTTAAGSGGPSGYSSQPSWQSGLGLPTQSGGPRYLPDVSLFAANGDWNHFFEFCMSDTSQGGTTCDYTNDTDALDLAAGGTSFSSPIMAGIQALINQAQGASQGNPNPKYYNLANTEFGASGNSACNSSLGTGEASYCVFNDVTLGDIDVNCANPKSSTAPDCFGQSGSGSSAIDGALSTSTSALSIAYGTTTGWDFATGLGSVNVYNLIKNWSGVMTSTAVASGSNPALQGVSVTFTATITPVFGTGETGTVAWGSNTGCAPSAVSGGAATCTTSSLPLGSNTVTATYSGDSNFAGSNGTVQQMIDLTGPATMTSPAAGSTLGTSNVQFTWNASIEATDYELWLGTSGPGSSGLYSSGLTTATSVTVPTIPVKGLTVYARLFTVIGGKSQFNDYTYTETVPGVPATMSSPTAGSTLGISNVQFTWTAGSGVTDYELWLGTSGPGSSGLYSSGLTTSLTATVATIPAKGLTVYARLFSVIAGKSQYNDYTYTETVAGVPATMSSPTAGSTLGTSNVQFTWTAGTGVTSYELWLGTSGAGSSSLYSSGAITALTATVPSIPAKGLTVYARLYSTIAGKSQYNDYTYTETVAGTPATMISPTTGSTLGTSNVQFTWTAGTGVTSYELWLGTSGPGSSSLYSSGLTTSMSTTVPTIPAKGLTVYARLFSTIGGKSQYNDYTYTEQ